MLSRQEYKFLVNNDLLNDLRNDLKPYVQIDNFADMMPKKEYSVRSIYFDTSGLDCFSEKIEGIKVRKKFRLRGYNENDEGNVLFWEIKRKYNSYIEKNRAPFHYKNLEAVIGHKKLNKSILSSENGSEIKDAKRFLYNYYRKGLRPVALVVYEREAFISKFNSFLRITFDKNLRSILLPNIKDIYSKNQLKYALPGYFILEIKFNAGFPSWLTRIVQKYELNRRALSKYTMSLDSHKAPTHFSQIMFKEFHH